MNLAGKTIRWKPLGHGIGVEERSINSFGGRPEHSVKPDLVRIICCHKYLLSQTGRAPNHSALRPVAYVNVAGLNHQFTFTTNKSSGRGQLLRDFFAGFRKFKSMSVDAQAIQKMRS
jgi:hypothetical protein